MAEATPDGGGLESSDIVEMVASSSLVDFTGTPTSSTIVHVKKLKTFSLFVEAIPQTSQAIHMKIQSSPHADQSVWYTQGNGDVSDADLQTWVFKQATNVLPIELGPFEGASEYLKVIYGYVGGAGTGASLKVYLMGRSQ